MSDETECLEDFMDRIESRSRRDGVRTSRPSENQDWQRAVFEIERLQNQLAESRNAALEEAARCIICTCPEAEEFWPGVPSGELPGCESRTNTRTQN
jgi:hypothetical protein